MQQTKELAKRLALLASELSAIAEELELPMDLPVFPEKARAKYEAGVCLGKDKKKGDCQKTKADCVFRRGLCPAHYAKTTREFKGRKAVERQAIERGLIAPPGFDPNPSEITQIANELDSQEQDLLAAAKVAGSKTARGKRTAKKHSN